MATLKIAKREFHNETVIGYLHKDLHSKIPRWFIQAIDSQYFSRIDISTLKDYNEDSTLPNNDTSTISISSIIPSNIPSNSTIPNSMECSNTLHILS